jgi:hypothetical protein
VSRPESSLACMLVIVSGSRITIAAVVVLWLIWWKHTHNNMVTVIKSGVILISIYFIVFLVLSLFSNEPLFYTAFERYKLLFNMSFVDLYHNLIDLFITLPVTPTHDDYMDLMYTKLLGNPYIMLQSNIDLSLLLRVYRWVTLLKSCLSSPETIIFGLGPSFASAAVDDNYVRIFIETGVIGFLLYIAFLVMLWREVTSDYCLRYYLIILIITAIFIDIFVSYKAMLFLWLYLGWKNSKKFKKVTVFA